MGRSPAPKVRTSISAVSSLQPTMTSPSQPVAIKSPRFAPAEPTDGISSSYTTPIGTPNLHALRAQYAGTPPMPNIPPRGSTPAQRNGSPAVSLVNPDAPSPLRPGPQAIGGLTATAAKNSNSSGSGAETPSAVDLEGLPDEEKAKIVGRHLVSKTERQNTPGNGSDLEVPQSSETGTSARRPSSGQSSVREVQDSDPFPIPYHAPGADVT